MSWDGYINDNVINDVIDKAIIIDMTGAAIWGKSSNAEVSSDEPKAMAATFDDNGDDSLARQHGIAFGGEKYVLYKVDSIDSRKVGNIPIWLAIKGKQGTIAAKCTQSILVAHYPESVQWPVAIEVLREKVEHIIANGL